MAFCQKFGAALLLGAMGVALPAAAKVIDQGDIGFTVAHTAQVAASPEEVWKMLRMPQKWWSSEHSWSGNAENFWLDSQAGGCFCEKLPDEGSGPGSVQHARILFAKPAEMLRLSGGLGPLQGEAVTGTLTIQIKKTLTGSAIRFDYIVGGYMRFRTAEIAPAVDAVLGEQLGGLARALGGALPPTRSEKADDKVDEQVEHQKGDAKAAKPPAERPSSGLGEVAADLARDVPKEN